MIFFDFFKVTVKFVKLQHYRQLGTLSSKRVFGFVLGTYRDFLKILFFGEPPPLVDDSKNIWVAQF